MCCSCESAYGAEIGTDGECFVVKISCVGEIGCWENVEGYKSCLLFWFSNRVVVVEVDSEGLEVVGWKHSANCSKKSSTWELVLCADR